MSDVSLPDLPLSSQTPTNEDESTTSRLLRTSLSRATSEERIAITVAETGSRIVVVVTREPDGTSSLLSVTDQIAQASKIPQKDQIILAGPPFKSYSRQLPPPDTDIYVYDRRTLQSRVTVPLPQLKDKAMAHATLQIPKTAPPEADPELESLKNQVSEAGGFQSPLHSTLPGYERSFFWILTKAKICAREADVQVQAIQDWGSCVSRQQSALQAAALNLKDHFQSVKRDYDRLSERMDTQKHKGKELLSGFPAALQQLQDVQLHPAFQSSKFQTLKDCIPVEKYEPFIAQCELSQEKLIASTNGFAEKFQNIEEGVEAQLKEAVGGEYDVHLSPATSEPEPGEGFGDDAAFHPSPLAASDAQNRHTALMKKAQVAGRAQAELMSAATEQYDSVRQTVHAHLSELLGAMTSMSERGSGSVMLRSAVDGLETKLEKAQASITRELDRNHQDITEIYLQLAEQLETGATSIRKMMREISKLQQAIVEFKQGIKLRFDALRHQHEDFMHLEIVHRLPEVYNQFVLEVRRRKASSEEFAACHNRCAELLNRLYTEEIEARESFARDYVPILPPCFFESFLPSLLHRPPKFRLDRAPDPPIPDLAAVVKETAEPDDADPGAMLVAPPALEEDPEVELLRLRKRVADLEMKLAKVSDPSSGSHETIESEEPLEEPVVDLTAPRSSVDELLRLTSTMDQLISGTHVDSPAENTVTIPMLCSLLRRAMPFVESSPQDQAQSPPAPPPLPVPVVSSPSPGLVDPKISYKTFQVDDIALFLPVPRNAGKEIHYLAFNDRNPRRFLAPTSVKFFYSQNERKYPSFILGKIILIDEHVAGPKGDAEKNPFNVTEGAIFWTLHIERV